MLRYFVFVITLSLFVAVFIGSFESCTKDKTLVGNTTLCDSANITYTTHIEPVLLNNCQICHGGYKPKLESYEQVVDAAKNGNLYCSINWTNGCRTMPEKSAKLPDSVLKFFDTWKCKNYPK